MSKGWTGGDAVVEDGGAGVSGNDGFDCKSA